MQSRRIPGTSPRRSGWTVTSASCCRNCGWPGSACRSCSASCSRCPFTNRFDQLSQGQRDLYLGTLVLAAVATALLLGPVAYHRLVFRQGQKEGLVRAASMMAIAGLITVGLAVSAAVLLVTGYVTSALPAALITAFVTGCSACCGSRSRWRGGADLASPDAARPARRPPQFDQPHAPEPAADLHTSQRIFIRERHGPEPDPEVLDHR